MRYRDSLSEKRKKEKRETKSRMTT